jgi:dihydroneopterin aldolase
VGDGAHRRRRAVAGVGAVTDYVSIRDLSVPAVIGVHDWERAIEQTLVFSVEMAADVRKPAASDDLADALDYSAVARTITTVVREGEFRLIETAAERVAERLLADFPVTRLRLEVRKPITAGAYTAAITIERTREKLPCLTRACPAQCLRCLIRFARG